ncbi:nitrate reductase molybdenum cofactor assembly chaperone [Patulibacter sp. SYSU D01012]|uniref:nitrate reductase molybdenum cofactor assembly chaperone n=1 Tax=Patulibacter sp. SYSU D01012 TaxID=2817381 RepID=UPI001B306A5A|nr:nitrate reductase molybdenum cofactor assembly chaperone [Patulibacter sp. SYSU D01012]
MTAFKLLSLLLAHPDAELVALWPDVLDAADELPPGPVRDGLLLGCSALLRDDRGAAIDDLAASRRYTATFDFDRRCALDLTYVTHGDRRQRGVALLKLRRLYARLGVEVLGGELPDHLPLLLELADALGAEDGGLLLADFRPALELLRGGLHKAGSAYAPLLDALVAQLGPLREDDAAAALQLAQDGPPGEDVGLEPFGPPESMGGEGRTPAPSPCGAAA